MPDEIDDLYGLPLESFVAERDALARRLKAEGRQEKAAEVSRLRKPTVAAWAVNQVVRTQPKARRELLAAARDLRRAQQRALSRGGAGAQVRKAGRREREALSTLMKAAEGLLSDKGRGLSAATLDRVRETLHAAVLDDEVREAVSAGRLDRERRAATLGPADAG